LMRMGAVPLTLSGAELGLAKQSDSSQKWSGSIAGSSLV
jgi:hypothetical protein